MGRSSVVAGAVCRKARVEIFPGDHTVNTPSAGFGDRTVMRAVSPDEYSERPPLSASTMGRAASVDATQCGPASTSSLPGGAVTVMSSMAAFRRPAASRVTAVSS